MQNSQEELKESWSSNAEAWTRAVREERIESRRLATNAAIIEAVAARPRCRTLDLGCGEGWLARELAQRGFDVAGVDGSAELVSKAAELGGGLFRTLSYEEITTRPDTLEGPYDNIVCNFSLLGEELRPLLMALRSQLSDSGCLSIQTLHPHAAVGNEPYRDGWRVESFAGMGDASWTPMPWYFRTIASWFNELGEAGYHILTLNEPVHPVTGRPLSLLLRASKRTACA